MKRSTTLSDLFKLVKELTGKRVYYISTKKDSGYTVHILQEIDIQNIAFYDSTFEWININKENFRWSDVFLEKDLAEKVIENLNKAQKNEEEKKINLSHEERLQEIEKIYP